MRACDCDRGRRRRRWENGCTPFNCQLVSEPCPTRLDTVTRRPGRQSSFLSLSLSLFFNSASSSSSSSSSSFVRRFFFVWVLLRRRMPAASHRVFLHRRRCSTSCFVAASNWPPPLLMWSLLALNQGHSMAFLCFVLFLFFLLFFFRSLQIQIHISFSIVLLVFVFVFVFVSVVVVSPTGLPSAPVELATETSISLVGGGGVVVRRANGVEGRDGRRRRQPLVDWLLMRRSNTRPRRRINSFREREREQDPHTHTHTHPTTTTTTTTKSYRFGRPRRPDMLNTHRLGVGPRFFFFILFFVVVVEIVLISPSLEKRRVRFYRSRSTWSAFLFARARVCVCVFHGVDCGLLTF